MSDLSRLRDRLVRIERQGRKLARELDELKALRLIDPEPLTRTEERAITRLDAAIQEQRQSWARIHALLKAEESRLLADPAAFLRFS